MARTLPWLLKGKKETNNATESSSPAPKRKRDTTPADLVDPDLNTTGVSTPERRKKIKAGRAPSSSPPPAPSEAPRVEYMHEGLTQDDAWMMVEDEFCSTAKVFTKHIHHAEYVRLKRRAKARGADTLEEIGRPTDGRTAQSTITKLEVEAKERRKQIQKSLKEIDSDEEDDEYMHNPQLAVLMGGSQSVSQGLAGVAKLKSNTRAAAGFTRSPKKSRGESEIRANEPDKASSKQQSSSALDEDTDSETDDDLDAPPRTKKSISSTQPQDSTLRPRAGIASASKPTASAKKSEMFKQFAKPPPRVEANGKVQETTTIRASAGKENRKQVKIEPTSPVKAERSSISGQIGDAPRKPGGILAKLKAAREKREQEKITEEDSLGDVPTFLI